MKRYFTFLIPVFLILSCFNCSKVSKEKDIIETYENQDEMVEQFVQSILDSTYNLPFLPDFNPEAITPLLLYADDFSLIYEYPHSTISSFYLQDKRLGECILWTIESIRVKYPFKDIFFQFVSSQPMLLDKKFLEDAGHPLAYRLDTVQLHVVYEAYKKWWKNYNHENFQQIRKIDPMDEFDYIWY
jgi:hypothetical protein